MRAYPASSRREMIVDEAGERRIAGCEKMADETGERGIAGCEKMADETG